MVVQHVENRVCHHIHGLGYLYLGSPAAANRIDELFGSDLFFTVTDERIREIDCGRIEGTTEDERIARWGANWRERDMDMEDARAVAKRGLSFLNELLAEYEDKKVLMISHGGLIGISLRHLLQEERNGCGGRTIQPLLLGESKHS